MRVAILGASSQIAKDLILSFGKKRGVDLLLYARDLVTLRNWIKQVAIDNENVSVHDYVEYGVEPHDVVINFVGVGDPRRAAQMGADILSVTTHFDDLVLENLQNNPRRRYLFLSSGAAYGNVFDEPANENTAARISINTIEKQDFYATAKLHAEVKHRSYSNLPIVDLRVFNYFSRTQDIEASFFITDIIRAIRDRKKLKTNSDYIVRDFLHPNDFYQLVNCIIESPPRNCAVDCYTREPIDKTDLLNAMQAIFGLTYEILPDSAHLVNATGHKSKYYSINRKASEFGYAPQLSSLEGLMMEAEAILGKPIKRFLN